METIIGNFLYIYAIPILLFIGGGSLLTGYLWGKRTHRGRQIPAEKFFKYGKSYRCEKVYISGIKNRYPCVALFTNLDHKKCQYLVHFKEHLTQHGTTLIKGGYYHATIKDCGLFLEHTNKSVKLT